MTGSSKKSGHYSYSMYAASAFAQGFDQSHFGGPIGQLVAGLQEQVLTEFLGNVQGTSVLDVGTGTGRAAIFLAKHGALVTGVDASQEMLKVARQRTAQTGLPVEFLPGDAHALTFPDQSFNTVISLRMLMHTPDWRVCLGELCRVADRRVLFDYPPLSSAATLQMVLRRMAKILGRRVETYHVLPTRVVRSVLEKKGFRIIGLHRQFVLPIAFHKLINSRSFTKITEKGLASIGLLHALGAPVTIVAERVHS